MDVLVSEGEKAQKRFDEKYGSGKAMFLKCDVSNKNELRGMYSKHNSGRFKAPCTIDHNKKMASCSFYQNTLRTSRVND